MTFRMANAAGTPPAVSHSPGVLPATPSALPTTPAAALATPEGLMAIAHLPPEYQQLAHLAAAQHQQIAMMGPLQLAEEASRQAEAAAQAAAMAAAAATSAQAMPHHLDSGPTSFNEMLENIMKNSVREYLRLMP